MQILNQQCLLNAAGVLLAGICLSMASYNACGFVMVCHLHFAVPGQEQECYSMHNPRKGSDPTSLLGLSIYFTLTSAEGKPWANFSCFTVIFFNYFRDWDMSRGISWAEYTLKPKPENCRTRETVPRMLLQSLFILKSVTWAHHLNVFTCNHTYNCMLKILVIRRWREPIA